MKSPSSLTTFPGEQNQVEIVPALQRFGEWPRPGSSPAVVTLEPKSGFSTTISSKCAPGRLGERTEHLGHEAAHGWCRLRRRCAAPSSPEQLGALANTALQETHRADAVLHLLESFVDRRSAGSGSSARRYSSSAP